MAIPDEDLGPLWLRDYEGAPSIMADLASMEEFAMRLRAEVETNYVTHLSPIYEEMAVPVPGASGGFAELDDLLNTHHEATQLTTNFVHDYANRSAHMAEAAHTISVNYGQSDAFASATVTGVHNALGQAGAATPNTGETPPAAGGSTEGQTIPATED